MGGRRGGRRRSSGRDGAARTGARIVRQLFKELTPLRLDIESLLMDALGGGDVLQNRFLAPQLGQIESSHAEALRSLMNKMPQGGSMERALSDLELGRLGQRSNAAYRTRMGLFDTAVNTAFGQPLSSTMGLAGSLANTQVQQNALNQQGMMGLAGGLGSIGQFVASGGVGGLLRQLGLAGGGGTGEALPAIVQQGLKYLPIMMGG